MLEAFDFVLFGGAGDLALRKLIPGLYRAHRNGELPEGTRLITTCRNQDMVLEYHAKIREATQQHLNANEFDATAWDSFVKLVYPVYVDIAKKDEKWDELAQLLNSGDNRQRVFYLSTPPSVFSVCCKHLHECNLITKTSRIVVEKPLGYDAKTAVIDPKGNVLHETNESGVFKVIPVNLNDRCIKPWLGDMRARFFKEIRSDVKW